jgi:hypothetical protein
MKRKIFTVLLIISLLINVFVLANILFSGFGRNYILSLYVPEANRGNSVSSSLTVNIPGTNANNENNNVEFGMCTVTLSAGQSAFFQWSIFYNNAQSNVALKYLYDNSIIGLEYNSYGVTIKAKKSGECAVQTFTGNEFITVLLVKVSDEN